MTADLKIPSPPEGWPQLREREVLVGLVGEVVSALEPHTESDPVALLLDFLAAFGNAVGRGPHMLADSAHHPARLNVVLVGETARARKGSSRANIRRLMEAADPEWADQCNASGLASGEGLIANLAGREDRRLYVTEQEFARVLKVAGRDGNILSPLIRQAWDGERLQNMTKKDPLKVDRSHMSLLAHITLEELHQVLPETEAMNGFGNRFLWACVRRSKKLSEGGNLSEAEVKALGRRIRQSLVAARKIVRLHRSEKSREVWGAMYDAVRDEPGLLGAVTARAEAQMLRLSITYALLDGRNVIEPPDLVAAAALWRYCSDSARYLFGDLSGDPVADRLLEALRVAGQNGLSFTEQRDVFGRHVGAHRLAAVRRMLEESDQAETREEPTAGRTRRVTYAL